MSDRAPAELHAIVPAGKASEGLHATLVGILHGSKLIESGARGMIDANTAHYLASMIVDGLGQDDLSGISG